MPGVAAPSANRFGRVSPTTRRACACRSSAPALLVLDGGACQVGIESAIVDCTRDQPALLRPGVLTRARTRSRCWARRWPRPTPASPRASGTLESHYAPAATAAPDATPTRCAHGAARCWPAGRPALGLAVYSRIVPAAGRRLCRTGRMPADAAAAAHELFAVLRDFDAAGVRLIWVEQPPPGPEWDGVRDRLAARPRPDRRRPAPPQPRTRFSEH